MCGSYYNRIIGLLNMRHFNNTIFNNRIYVFGNPLVAEDSLPVRLLPKLKNLFPDIDFQVVDPNENFPPDNEKDLVVFDTVFGIDEPRILSLDDFKSNKKTPLSPHDYDFLFYLLLLRKLKKINSIVIIGIPSKLSKDKLLNQLKVLINKK